MSQSIGRSKSSTVKKSRHKSRLDHKRESFQNNITAAPLRQLKNLYLGLRSRSAKSKSKSRSRSKDSKKETINLLINNPPTGLRILMDEAENIQNSPSIFP